ncbi:transcriptional regulator [Candidatus Nomurabacteria bacterium RIFCSPHIGHO2_01_FULL_38_19]|uniref:Transcriptional regulator n=1 Tax=Candidatus Nomurabacteria bacterium RIFCSPHIGHO2_01_FULL_38_19 TaxID=1801732 RepID=A0A1F6UR74_9BACT|nr:MAG: transcriptional regulator [Candidatus Nomurabacteria bacterium RIFCSPHIGHO2_01_FULL_38_19]
MAEDIKQKIGKKIKELRIKEGYSQEELASYAKLHRTYISDIERGERNVSIENIGKIAKALKTEPNELLNF